MLRLGEDLDPLITDLRRAPEQLHRQITEDWIDHNHARAAFVLDSLASWIGDLCEIAGPRSGANRR